MFDQWHRGSWVLGLNLEFPLPDRMSFESKFLIPGWSCVHPPSPWQLWFKKWIKKVPSALCALWLQHIETPNHLFWKCEIAQELWSQIQKFLEQRNIRFSKRKRTIFFGDESLPPVANLILILGKKIIYQSKCNYRKVTLETFKQSLSHTHDIEQSIAIRNGQIEHFQSRWLPILPI